MKQTDGVATGIDVILSASSKWILLTALIFSQQGLANTTTPQNEIAPVDKALTLAQIATTAGNDTLLITAQSGSTITAINLSKLLQIQVKDPLELISIVGVDRLRDLAISKTDEYPISDLVVPGGLSSEQLAAGANYADHGEEGGLESVFLFPKYSTPTANSPAIPVRTDQLLDYEIEVCARFDRNIQSMADFAKANVGLFLCGDFTDRATLMRKIDKDNWESGVGYTDAKSGTGLFPVGAFTVVPRDWPSFIDGIDLQLSVNGEVRQQDSAAKMLLKLDEILALAFAGNTSMRWIFRGQDIPILKDGILYRGQSILTGTPEGVVFRPPGTLFIISNALKWLATGSFMNSSVSDYVIENYIADRLAARTYLQPGDQISMMGTYLGAMNIGIVSAR